SLTDLVSGENLGSGGGGPQPGVRVLQLRSEMGVHGQRQRAAGAFLDGQDVGEAAPEARPGLRQPDRVDMRPDQVLVPQVEPWWGDAAGDHLVRAAEVVLVVRATRRAVRRYQRRLTGPAGATGTLGVVCWGRRHVTHRD